MVSVALIPGIAGLLLIAGLALLVWNLTWASRERPEIERSLALLDREIREWTRARHREQIPEPLHLRLLHLANPIGRRLVLPASMRDLEARVVEAGNPPVWTVDNIIAMKVVSVAAGLLVAVPMALQGSSNGLMVGVVVLLLGYEVPDLVIRSKASARQTLLRRTLPDSLDLLTVTVEAGLGFDAAVAQVSAHTTGPVSGEFRRYLQEKQIGLSSREALQSMAGRTSIPEMKSFTSALLQADRMGISIGPVLRELTAEMRIRRRQLAQEKAQQVPVKILLPMLLFIFPTFLIVVIGPVAINAITRFGG